MTTKNEKPTNEEQIRWLVNNWAKAIRARDLEGASAHHAKDIVMFDVPLPLQSKGIEAYKKTWELFFDTNRDDKVPFDLRELKVVAGDTIAFCHALLIAGSAKKPQGRLTIGLRKVRGKWLITHEHHSYPIGES